MQMWGFQMPKTKELVPRCDECNSKDVYRKQDASWSKKTKDWTQVESIEFYCLQCGNPRVDVDMKFYGGYIDA